MADIAELKLKLSASGGHQVVGELNAVDRGIKAVEADSHKAGGALRGMFGIGAGVAIGGGILALGKGVFDLGKGFIGINANAEQAKMSLEIVTGSAAKANALFKDLQAFAAKTPFSFPELEQAAINLESFGLKTQDWIGTIGDTAAAMSKSVDQVTQAVLDAQTGQFERLKELGIKASIAGDQLTFQYLKNGKTITQTVDRNNQDVINSTLQGIWNDKYKGAMETQSRTFNGQLSTLKDNININMGQVTSGVFTALRGLLSFGNDVFAVGWKQAIENAFGDSTLGDFLTNVGTLVSGIVAAFGEGSPVKDIVDKLPASWQAFATPILTFFDSFGDVWSRFKSGGTLDGLKQLGSELKTIAAAGLDLALVGITATFHLVSNIAGSIYDWLKNQLFGGGDPMLQGLPGAVPPIDVGDVLVRAAALLGGEIADAAKDFGAWVKGKLHVGENNTVDIGNVTLQGNVTIENTGADGKDPGKGFVQKTLDAIYATASAIHAAGMWVVDGLVTGFGLGVGFAGGGIVDAVGLLVFGIVTAIEDPAAVARVNGALRELVRKAVEIPAAGFASLVDKFWSGVATGFSAAIPDSVEATIRGRIAKAIGDALALPFKLTGFALDIGVPVIGNALTGAIGLAVGVKAAIHNALIGLGDLTETWPNAFNLSLPAWLVTIDKFPTIDDIFDFVLAALQDLGDLAEDWPNAFNLSFSLPSLGDFPSLGDIWNLVWNALRALGDLRISWPNGFTVDFPSVSIPSIPFVGGHAGGGIVTTPLSLVGEQGPELVALPMGSRVFTAPQTRAMLAGARGGSGGGATTVINVDARGGYFGRGAREELLALAAQQSAKIADQRYNTRRFGESR